MLCLKPEKLIQYSDGRLSENENKKIIGHLETCDRCARNLHLLKQLDEILSMQGRKPKSRIDNQDLKRCINDDLLFRYLEGKVTEAEANAIQRHLNSCETCFDEMASLLRNSLSPATNSEKKALAEMRTITPEGQVSKILSVIEKECPPTPKVKMATIVKLTKSVKEYLEKWFAFKYSWRPVFATLVIIAGVIGAYRAVRYYHTGYQIWQAENLLVNKHRIYIENARLSGGYGSTGISMLMAPGEEKPPYLEQAKSRLNRAGARTLKAKQLLAQIFIIEKEYAKADSILAPIEKEAPTSAALLNDIGVLYFQRKDWKKAAHYFQSAVEADTGFLEAYYNLALAQVALGATDDAITTLNKYIVLERDEVWRDAALHLKSKFQKVEEEMN